MEWIVAAIIIVVLVLVLLLRSKKKNHAKKLHVIINNKKTKMFEITQTQFVPFSVVGEDINGKIAPIKNLQLKSSNQDVLHIEMNADGVSGNLFGGLDGEELLTGQALNSKDEIIPLDPVRIKVLPMVLKATKLKITFGTPQEQ